MCRRTSAGSWPARAASTLTEERLQQLTKLQAQLEDAYPQEDHDRAVRLNHEFHRAINVAADSPKLSQLMGQITRYGPEAVFPTVEGWRAQSIKDHRPVIAALEQRDENEHERRWPTTSSPGWHRWWITLWSKASCRCAVIEPDAVSHYGKCDGNR